jgi:hypothetical protein
MGYAGSGRKSDEIFKIFLDPFEKGESFFISGKFKIFVLLSCVGSAMIINLF